MGLKHARRNPHPLAVAVRVLMQHKRCGFDWSGKSPHHRPVTDTGLAGDGGMQSNFETLRREATAQEACRLQLISTRMVVLRGGKAS